MNYTIEGTASNGLDYAQLTGTVTIPAGKRVAAIRIRTLDDAEREQIETVALKLVAGTDYTYSLKSKGIVRIADNDGPRGRIPRFRN